MSKLAWSSLIAVVVVAASGGAYYFMHHRLAESVPTPAPAATEVLTAPEGSSRDDEMRRRKLEGIGSTRNLKPVDIPNNPR